MSKGCFGILLDSLIEYGQKSIEDVHLETKSIEFLIPHYKIPQLLIHNWNAGMMMNNNRQQQK